MSMEEAQELFKVSVSVLFFLFVAHVVPDCQRAMGMDLDELLRSAMRDSFANPMDSGFYR